MIQKKLIENAIKNLNEFGYPDVTEKDIFTDLIYSQMFKRMLEDNKGIGFDKDINILLSKINTDTE